MVAPVISDPARQAIAEGVRRGDPITDLELLGLPLRVINILEQCPYHITKLEHLVSLTREQLSAVEQIGDYSMNHILACLSRYEEMEHIKRMRETLLRRHTEALREKVHTG